MDNGDGSLDTPPASGLERKRIHPEVISVVVDVVERLRDCDGCIDALSDWFHIDELWSSKSDYRPQIGSQVEETAETTKVARRRRREDARRKMKRACDAGNAFLEIGNHIFSQIQNLEERLEEEEIADRLSLLSLPDEILAIIFRNAIDGTRLDEEDSIYLALAHVQASASLSHVCQRFRHVAISIPHLWNCTSNWMSTDLVEMCVSRLAIPIAEVSVTTTSKLASIESSKSYLSTVVPFSQRWRRYEHEQLRFTIDILKEVASFTHNLNAPHLSELSIAYSTAPLKLTNGERSQADREAIHYYSTWSCPMLTSVATRNFIPVPYMIPNSPSLKELYMSMNFERDTPKFSLGDLASFLSSLVQLEDLTLQFFSLNSNIEEMDSPISTKVALSSLRKLCINLYRCDAEYVDAIFTNIRFPNAVSLKLCVWRLKDWVEGENVDDVVRIVFPDDRSFPKLDRLELGIGGDSGGKFGWEPRRYPLRTVRIPFASLALVKHFTLVGTNHDFAPLPEGRYFRSLRSLTLKDCKKLNREWTIQFLSDLFNQKCLHPSQLTVENCKWTRMAEELKIQDEDDSDSDEYDDEDQIEDLDYRSVSAEEMIELAQAAN